jgi:hypothetical protein
MGIVPVIFCPLKHIESGHRYPGGAGTVTGFAVGAEIKAVLVVILGEVHAAMGRTHQFRTAVLLGSFHHRAA